MSETTVMPALATQILNLARHKEIKEIESSWLEFIESPPVEAEFYTQFIQSMTKAGAVEPAHNLIVMLLDQLQGRLDWKLMYRIINAVAGTFPQSPQIRKFAARALTEYFKSNPNAEALIAASKINDSAPVDQAVKRFRSLLRLCPGNVFQHKAWGEGMIRTLDISGGKVIIDFPTEKGKSMTFEGVKNFLVYLQPDHFLARRIKEPEKLWALGEESPIALIKLALGCVGGKIKQANLKTLLVGSIIPPASWNSWWNRARQELRMDPMTDFDSKSGAHAEIAMRSHPKTFEEEMEDAFFDTEADLAGRIICVGKLVDAQKSRAADPKLLARMLKRLEEDYQVALVSKQLTKQQQLETAFLAQDLRAMGGGKLDADAKAIPAPEVLLAEFKGFEELKDVDNVGYAMRALKFMMARGGNKSLEEALELFPSAPVKLAQAIWRELDEEHHLDLAVKALEQLFDNALNNPDTYFWAVKAIAEANWNHLEDYFPLTWLVPHLFDDLDSWQDAADDPRAPKEAQAAAKQLSSKVRSLLQAKHCAAICSAAEGMSLDQVQRLRKTIQQHPALNETFKAAADKQLRLTRKDLETAAPAPPTEADVHYCTGRMRAEKLRELAELNGVTIPANSREIETARQEGDLRENAGYHAAKDKQKMLMQQTLQLQQALSITRVITAQNVRTDAIGFGTTFEADNLASGKTESFTVLGRWEADPEKHILSYLAPMVQQFLGKKAGDEIVIKHPGGGETPYRILSISNALASGEWDVKEE